MEKIFVISCNRYTDDNHSYDICSAKTKQRANEIVSKLKDIEKYNNTFSILHEEYLHQYDIDNHLPICPDRPQTTEDHKASSKLCSLNNSPHNIKEYHKHQKIHQNNLYSWQNEYDKFNIIHKEYKRVKSEAEKIWIEQNYNLPTILKEVEKYFAYDTFPNTKDVDFSILEIDIL